MPTCPPEPFRIKVTESIHLISLAEHEVTLKEAGCNPFVMKAEDIFIYQKSFLFHPSPLLNRQS